MKIALFTDTYHPQINGVTNTISRMETYLKKHDIEYKIFAPDYNLKEKKEHVETFYSIKFFLYPECRLSMVRKSRIKKILSEFRPDIVHMATEFNMGWAGLNYAQDNQLPRISTFTTNYTKYLKYYNLDMLTKAGWDYFRWFHNQNDLTLCPSQDTQKLLKEKGIKNVDIWGRGIDTSQFSPQKRNLDLRRKLNMDGKIMLLYVGRVSIEKDLDVLFNAYSIIKTKYKNKIALVIAGDGPMLEKYKTEHKDVIFTGYVQGEKLSQLYASADIFTFPSSTETLGNVVLEAMASEVPVVGVKSGGVKENIIEGYNGIMCKPRDTKSFYESITRLIENIDYRIQIGENARKYTYSKQWDKIFDKLVYHYQEVIHNRKREAA